MVCCSTAHLHWHSVQSRFKGAMQSSHRWQTSSGTQIQDDFSKYTVNTAFIRSLTEFQCVFPSVQHMLCGSGWFQTHRGIESGISAISAGKSSFSCRPSNEQSFAGKILQFPESDKTGVQGLPEATRKCYGVCANFSRKKVWTCNIYV